MRHVAVLALSVCLAISTGCAWRDFSWLFANHFTGGNTKSDRNVEFQRHCDEQTRLAEDAQRLNNTGTSR
jgi:hypothetical protein